MPHGTACNQGLLELEGRVQWSHRGLMAGHPWFFCSLLAIMIMMCISEGLLVFSETACQDAETKAPGSRDLADSLILINPLTSVALEAGVECITRCMHVLAD